MIINSFGLLSKKKLIIFNYSYERKFHRENISKIYLYSYRNFLPNILILILGIVLLVTIELRAIQFYIIASTITLFFFFYKYNIYECIIIESLSLTKIKIAKKDKKNAEKLIKSFYEQSTKKAVN